MEKLAYREAKSTFYYVLSLLGCVFWGLLLGATFFFAFFMMVLLLGMETDAAGTLSLWAGGAAFIFFSTGSADRITENRCIYCTDRAGKLFILESSGFTGTFSYPVPSRIPCIVRKDIAMARRLDRIPPCAVEIQKVYRSRISLSGRTVRCQVDNGCRTVKRTLILYRDMVGYQWLTEELHRKKSGR